MAKVSGTSDQYIRGQVGSRIYRVLYGKQNVYEAPQWNLTKVRTASMLDYRNQFSVLASVSRAFKGATEGTFEKLDRGSKTVNMFIHYNKGISKVYLTRKEVAEGMRLLEPFYVSHGSLEPSITTYEQNGNLVSSICVGNLTIDENTTVSQLADAILMNNSDFDRYAPESILFMRAAQVPAGGGLPASIKVKHANLDLKLAVGDQPSPKVYDVVGRDGFGVVPVTTAQGKRANFLCCPIIDGTGACWVHSRIINKSAQDGGTLVCTTQQLVMPTNPLAEPYTTEVAKVLSYNSYGGINREYSNSPNNPTQSAPGSDPLLPNEPMAPSASQYSLYVIAEPLASGTVTGSGTYAAGTDVQLKATPAAGYAFDSWSDGFDLAERTIEMPACPTTYAAIFKPLPGEGGGSTPGTDPTPQQVVISTAVSPTGAGTVSGGGTYSAGAQVTLTATATDAETAPFTKWSDGVTENPRTVTATTNRTYTALFGTQQGGSTEGGGGMGEGR